VNSNKGNDKAPSKCFKVLNAVTISPLFKWMSVLLSACK
jgi:hypothetical protein